jgi:alkylation response protein AidB-like acyl-CoA dehydrogenase
LLASIEDTRRLMMAAELSGAVDCLVDMAVEYARMRKQFGRPIGSFQALQHMLAELAARGGALRHLVAATLDDVAADPTRLHELAIIAKAYACTTGRYAAEESLQVHGGIGFTNDLPLHLYYRRVLTHQGFLGESDALMCELGRLMLASALTATTEGT